MGLSVDDEYFQIKQKVRFLLRLEWSKGLSLCLTWAPGQIHAGPLSESPAASEEKKNPQKTI